MATRSSILGNISLEDPQGQRSLAGCSPWGHKESDMTERLHTHTHTHTHSFFRLSSRVTSSERPFLLVQSTSHSL